MCQHSDCNVAIPVLSHLCQHSDCSVAIPVPGTETYVPAFRLQCCHSSTEPFFEKNEMGGACGAYGGGESGAQGASGET